MERENKKVICMRAKKVLIYRISSWLLWGYDESGIHSEIYSPSKHCSCEWNKAICHL